MSQVYKADINGDGSTPTPQGFLDYEGVKHLWSKVSMKDYPNNETLAAVINAIDETKADKSELFSGSWNDLEDKPFYNENIEVVLLNEVIQMTSHFEGNGTYFRFHDVSAGDHTRFKLEDGATYRVTFNDEIYICTAYRGGFDTVLGSYDASNIGDVEVYKYPFSITGYEVYVVGNVDSATFKVEKGEFALKTLDDKFISDNIARVSDIPKELTTEDAIALATETGLIDPIATTSDNTILTDVNDNIITL